MTATKVDLRSFEMKSLRYKGCLTISSISCFDSFGLFINEVTQVVKKGVRNDYVFEKFKPKMKSIMDDAFNKQEQQVLANLKNSKTINTKVNANATAPIPLLNIAAIFLLFTNKYIKSIINPLLAEIITLATKPGGPNNKVGIATIPNIVLFRVTDPNLFTESAVNVSSILSINKLMKPPIKGIPVNATKALAGNVKTTVNTPNEPDTINLVRVHLLISESS